MIFMHFNSKNSSLKFNRPHAFNEKQRLNKIQREHLVQFPSQVSLQEVQQELERTIKLTKKKILVHRRSGYTDHEIDNGFTLFNFS